MYKEIKKELIALRNKNKADVLMRFFKTGRGGYGEGDVFLGITNPIIRENVKKYYKLLNLDDVKHLLPDRYHEIRLFALLCLVEMYKKSDDSQKEEIFNLYLSKTEYINNWDLVDLSAPNIVGDFLLNRDKTILFKLSESNNLWEQRIAIVSTLKYAKYGVFEPQFLLAERLLSHKHDLIHKAVGWVLRECGKVDENKVKQFLMNNYKHIPRTTLRYAIERFPKDEYKIFLRGVF